MNTNSVNAYNQNQIKRQDTYANQPSFGMALRGFKVGGVHNGNKMLNELFGDTLVKQNPLNDPSTANFLAKAKKSFKKVANRFGYRGNTTVNAYINGNDAVVLTSISKKSVDKLNKLADMSNNERITMRQSLVQTDGSCSSKDGVDWLVRNIKMNTEKAKDEYNAIKKQFKADIKAQKKEAKLQQKLERQAQRQYQKDIQTVAGRTSKTK